MWFRTTELRLEAVSKRAQTGVPSAITPTPALAHVETMLANCARLPRFVVKIYDTVW